MTHDAGIRVFHVARRCTVFTICTPRTPAFAERFATTLAILDLDRTRDNAPHTAEG